MLLSLAQFDFPRLRLIWIPCISSVLGRTVSYNVSYAVLICGPRCREESLRENVPQIPKRLGRCEELGEIFNRCSIQAILF